MPVPSSINDLAVSPSDNGPQGSESVVSTDDYLRAHASFIAQLRDYGSAASLAADLANSTDVAKGSALVKHNPALDYAAGTVGAAVNSLQDDVTDLQRVTNPELVQKRMCELSLGFDNGTTNTEIFTGAQNTSQGLAYAKVGSTEKLFLLQRTVTDTNLVTERHRIVEFTLASDGSVINNTAYSAELSIGHQGLSARVDGSTVHLYGQMTVTAGHEGTDSGKGYSRTVWGGAGTTQANVTNYQLWGYAGSGHRFSSLYGATVAVSTDGRYVVLVGSDTSAGGESEDTINVLAVYDRAEVEAAADPLTVNPVYFTQLAPPNAQRNQYNQGVACDGRYIYISRGFYGPLMTHTVQKFDFLGNLVQEISLDDVRALYGIGNILNHPTLGTPISFEPEGIALRETQDGPDILLLSMDNWRAGAPIVSYQGENWASLQANNLGNSPDNELYWVRTTKAATVGAWDAATTYGNGTNYTRRSKMVYALRTPRGESGEEGVCSGIANKESGASLNSRSNAVDMAWRYGDDFQVSAYSENTRRYYKGVQYGSQSNWRVFDQRPGADNSKYVYVGANFSGGREIMELRARDSGLANGAGINAYGKGDSGSPGKIILSSYDTATSTNKELHMQGNGTFRVGVDLQSDIGTAALRHQNIFANRFRPGDGTAMFTSCTGTPEAQITASVGSLCLRLDGSAGTRLYWKNSGSGNTGWVAIL